MDKLIIKIKISQAENELLFACPSCDKKFNSGKALGGHKRVHMMKEKEESHQTRDRQENSDAKSPDPKCPVCDQLFPSDKALHGHMRKHPDRNWRGMKPPTQQLNNGESSLVPYSGRSVAKEGNPCEGGKQLAMDDLALLGWPRSTRRSRHGKAPVDPDDDLSMNGVYNLMALANGEPPKELNIASWRKKLELSFPSNSGNSGRSTPKKMPLAIHGGFSFKHCNELANPGRQSSIKGKGSLSIYKYRNVKKNPGGSQKQYFCNICDRPFRSYQALGGHISHHNNLKAEKVRSAAEADDGSAPTAAGSLVVNVGQPEGGRSAVGQCLLCDEIFPTGEALADHIERCSGPAPLSKLPRCGGEEETGKPSSAFDFDLNELPPEWDEEMWGVKPSNDD